MTKLEKIIELEKQNAALLDALKVAKAELLAIEQDNENDTNDSTPDTLSDTIVDINEVIHKVTHNLL